jgi:uncharacterized membrane protein YbhN (UPF0104 family)
MLMTPDSKTHVTSLIIWSLVWAFTLIATAFVFKGNPVKGWIEAVLFIGALTFWLWKSRQLVCAR